MGLFFRKSIKLGILHINFSKSGIGFSFGIPGFRIINPSKGKMYFQTGKNNIYYRKNLN
jgi:hypothetical protein